MVNIRATNLSSQDNQSQIENEYTATMGGTGHDFGKVTGTTLDIKDRFDFTAPVSKLNS